MSTLVGSPALSYEKGIEAEKKAKKWAEEKGYTVIKSEASRGSGDLLLGKQTLGGLSDKRHLVQVKSTSEDTVRIKRDEAVRLKRDAEELGASPNYLISYEDGDDWRSFPVTLGRRGRRPYFSTRIEERNNQSSEQAA